MKIFFSQVNTNSEMIEEDLAPLDLKESIRKTRQALDIAYAGFDNAIESDLIDSYIYEINALQKRYQHLTELAASQPVRQEKTLIPASPIRALVGRFSVNCFFRKSVPHTRSANYSSQDRTDSDPESVCKHHRAVLLPSGISCSAVLVGFCFARRQSADTIQIQPGKLCRRTVLSVKRI